MAEPLRVEFHFDFGSPNAYLAELVLPGIEQRTGVKFDYVPVLLGGVYKATGNMSPGESLRGIKNKPEYKMRSKPSASCGAITSRNSNRTRSSR
jgi:2-hydroxychromene-2-carboxylate isomerase